MNLHTSSTDSLAHNADTLFGIEWSVSRHQLIAGAAERLLTPTAQTQVQAILALLNEQSLSSIAGWADQIKRRQPQPGDDPDTVAFLNDTRNDGNPSWHFVNLPVNADAYSRERYPTFTNDEDVVQMIQASTQVLMGTSDRFSRPNALRLVVHLVGDVHQPLHVGCSYIGLKNGKNILVRDPDKAVGLPNDRGGNNILLPTGGNGTSMHSFWDSSLPGHIDESQPADINVAIEADNTGDTDLLEENVQKLLTMINDQQASASVLLLNEPADATPVDQWAVTWATESLLQAREAYKSLSIQQKVGQKFKVKWEGKAAYVARCTPIVSERMTAAANNLANLLNTLFA